MKRFLTVLLCFITVFCTVSCKGKDSSANYGEEVPVYTSDKQFYIGMWIGVPDSVKSYTSEGAVVPGSARRLTDEEFDEQYKNIKEAGFTHAEGGYGEKSDAYNLRALAAAEKYGIKQYIHNDEINAYLMNTTLSEEEVEQNLRTISAKFTAYSSFAGLKVRDEPALGEIKNYSVAKQRFDKVFGKDKIFYMNLLPVVSSPSAIGSDYKAYIREFVNQIGTDYVSYDHYPLISNKNGNQVIENFLFNMKLVKQVAPEKDMWTFLQSMQYGSNNRALESSADATFQVYSFLAMGGVGIQWFCYWSPPPYDGSTRFGVACVDRDGSLSPAYDYVKTANLELKGLENIYFNFDWQGAMPLIGSKNDDGGENKNFNYLLDTAIKSHDRIKSAKVEQDTLIGVFKDKDNRDGFMVVNFTEPSAGISDKAEFVFNDCIRAIVVKNGVQTVVDCKNGKLTLNLPSGAGYFVIPLK